MGCTGRGLAWRSCSCCAAPAERREGALVPQRHGFEGTGFSREDSEPDGLLPPPPPNVPGRLPHGDTAIQSVAPNQNLREGRLPEITHLNDFGPVIGPGIEEVLPPATDSRMTVVIALHGSQLRDEIRVSIHQSEERIELASIERVIRPLGQVQVLPRHRSPSMPLGLRSTTPAVGGRRGHLDAFTPVQ